MLGRNGELRWLREATSEFQAYPALSGDGRLLALVSEGVLRLMDLEGGGVPRDLPYPTPPGKHVARADFSPDARRLLVTTSSDGRRDGGYIDVIDVRSGLVDRYPGGSRVVWRPDGKRVVWTDSSTQQLLVAEVTEEELAVRWVWPANGRPVAFLDTDLVAMEATRPSGDPPGSTAPPGVTTTRPATVQDVFETWSFDPVRGSASSRRSYRGQRNYGGENLPGHPRFVTVQAEGPTALVRTMTVLERSSGEPVATSRDRGRTAELNVEGWLGDELVVHEVLWGNQQHRIWTWNPTSDRILDVVTLPDGVGGPHVTFPV